MKKRVSFVSLFFVLFAVSAVAGEKPDAASSQALMETQTMLQSPELRAKVIHDNSGAQTVDAQVQALTGNPQVTNELYGISGKILEDLTKETGGDPVKMLEIMSKAEANPASLLDHLSEQNKDAIHSVSTQIEKAPTTVNRRPADSK